MKIESEKLVKQMKELLKERGSVALKETRKTILKEEIECKKVKEALNYFILKYWHDLARPTLLSISCEAVGGDPAVTIPFAVSLSLISGALDIHDDIIDETEVKNGLPTVYGKYGRDLALLTADALLFKGFYLLQKACMQTPKDKAISIMESVNAMFYHVGDAEALELDLRKRWKILPEEYMRIIEKKAADVEAHTFIGALLGDGTEEEKKGLRKYGRYLGMLLIIRDDVADLFHPQEIIHRIKKEHLPLPVIFSLNSDYRSVHASIREIKRACKKIPTNAFKKLIYAVRQTGGLAQTQTIIEDLANKAKVNIKDIRKNKAIFEFILQSVVANVEVDIHSSKF